MISAVLLVLGQSAPPALNDATFAAVKQHASPTAEDLAFQSLDWRTTIHEGLIAAQSEDKPMIMWMYFGDPRGHC